MRAPARQPKPFMGHINNFLVCAGRRYGVGESQLPGLSTARTKTELMIGNTFAVTHHTSSNETREDNTLQGNLKDIIIY